MGKLLIIKDADFSANGVQLGTITNISSTITLAWQKDINGTANKSYVANSSLIDLTQYIEDGYDAIVVSTLTYDTLGYYQNHCLRMSDVNGKNGKYVQPYTEYTRDDIIIPLDASMPYLKYSCHREDGQAYRATSYTANAIAVIKLIKY